MYSLQMTMAIQIADSMESVENLKQQDIPENLVDLVDLIIKTRHIVDGLIQKNLTDVDIIEIDAELTNIMELWGVFNTYYIYDMYINDIYLYLVSLYPKFIQFIPKKYITRELCFKAVHIDGENLKYLIDDDDDNDNENKFSNVLTKELYEELYEAAVTNNGNALQYIKEPSDAIIFKAIDNEPDAIELVPVNRLTSDMALMAVLGDGMELAYLYTNHQFLNFPITQDIIDKATFENSYAIRFIPLPIVFNESNKPFLTGIYLRSICRNPGVFEEDEECIPSNYMTIYIAIILIYFYARNIKYLPPRFKTVESYEIAVQLDPTVLIDMDVKDITQDICDLALRPGINIAVIYHAYPRHKKTKEEYARLQTDLKRILQYVPEEYRTLQICQQAYNLDHGAFRYIPPQHQASIVRWRLRNGGPP
jgi:hypothetical protein